MPCDLRGVPDEKGLQVRLADDAGMCFGVRRALDIAGRTAREAATHGSRVYVAGQLVHNRQVSDYLNGLGITELSDEDLANHDGGDCVYIIPSHGKGPLVYDIVKGKGNTIADAARDIIAACLGATGVEDEIFQYNTLLP